MAGRFVGELLAELGGVAAVGANLMDLEHHARRRIKERRAQSCHCHRAVHGRLTGAQGASDTVHSRSPYSIVKKASATQKIMSSAVAAFACIGSTVSDTTATSPAPTRM